jgi:hypothetical protein
LETDANLGREEPGEGDSWPPIIHV